MKRILIFCIAFLFIGLTGCGTNEISDSKSKGDSDANPSTAIKNLQEKKEKEVVYTCSADFTTQQNIHRKLVYYLKGNDNNKLIGFYYKNVSDNFKDVDENTVNEWVKDGGKEFIKFMTDDGAIATASVDNNSSVFEASYENLGDVEITSSMSFLIHLCISQEASDKIFELKYIPMDILLSEMENTGTIKCQ